jgi:hypothetical protein
MADYAAQDNVTLSRAEVGYFLIFLVVLVLIAADVEKSLSQSPV